MMEWVKVSWDDDIPNRMESHKSHVPKHQSESSIQQGFSTVKRNHFRCKRNIKPKQCFSIFKKAAPFFAVMVASQLCARPPPQTKIPLESVKQTATTA